MLGDIDHFDLGKGMSGLSKSSERLLLKIYQSANSRIHYTGCCGFELQVRDLIDKNLAKLDHSYFLGLTDAGKKLAKNLVTSREGGGGFFKY